MDNMDNDYGDHNDIRKGTEILLSDDDKSTTLAKYLTSDYKLNYEPLASRQ
jgi:hypothetical protein